MIMRGNSQQAPPAANSGKQRDDLILKTINRGTPLKSEVVSLLITAALSKAAQGLIRQKF